MKIYSVLMTQVAADDLKGISRYITYDLKEPIVAKKQITNIFESIMTLETLPTRHNLVCDKTYSNKGIRKILIGNYVVFFVVSETDSKVTVIRILYSRRDWINLI
jgi:plasmid stabilization system protein ParE